VTLSATLDRLYDRYPSLLVDRVDEYEPGRRLVAVKNVTVNEECFQGHYPGEPLLPAVLTIEALAQAATVLLSPHVPDGLSPRVSLRGVDGAKFRRRVVPGDQLRLEVVLERAQGPLAWVGATASVDAAVVAQASLVMHVRLPRIEVAPSALVHPSAQLGPGCIVGPGAQIGAHVVVGARCRIGASAILDGHTILGDDNVVFPFASIGLPPQDLKYAGEPTRLEIGEGNTFREFVTIHRGTAGGGGLTRIGHRNLFMAYAHVAHDCHVGDGTIFGNAATLGGHVEVGDCATISAYSGVHQFCRIGSHAFIGGYSVVTKDALPFARSVGNRASVYGLNSIGLKRRGFSPDRIAQLRRAFRYLLQSRLNRTQALTRIADDPTLTSDDVAYLVTFIRTATRGVTLRRGRSRAADAGDE
jgi:UDP-N-acetylglucosamine acyltransferase